MSEQAISAEKEAEVQTDPALPRKKRMALIVYLAILFIAALVIVTLSLVIQIHRSTTENATFADKAQSLQTENETLRQQVSDLQKEKDALVTENGQLQAELDAQTEENGQLQAANDELEEQNGNIRKAYDLLSEAKAARESGDEEAFQAAVEQLEPLYQYLSETAQAEYDALIDAES